MQAILLLCIILSFSAKGFLSLQNLEDVVTSSAFTGILSMGLLVVLISGGVDISFAATASIAQYTAMTAANQLELGWISTVTIFLLVGIVMGLVNALLVSYLKLSSIIVTIATQSLFYGLLMSITNGQDIFALPTWFNDGIHWVLKTSEEGANYGINLQMIGLAVCMLFTYWLLDKTNIGRQIYAAGGNTEAARRIGFNVFRLNLIVYGYMGLTAGVAALCHAQMVQSVSPSALVGRELDVLAAVVLGGASLNGGIGTVSGTILGVALLAILQNGLALLGVSSYWSPVFTGLVILLAVALMAHDQNRAKSALIRKPV